MDDANPDLVCARPFAPSAPRDSAAHHAGGCSCSAEIAPRITEALVRAYGNVRIGHPG